ncbi:hypothetical protein AB2B41_17510 [Marimonas sp. MJW-29]|uniref:Uncharacterized protein n=1 Tax=Sulfitobacter sediminis TaxID=3234186 RepID=A0ABV3RR32_9RHOB
MAQNTIHDGGSRRGLVIALLVLAVFVLGIAMLGNGSMPDDVTPTATATD